MIVSNLDAQKRFEFGKNWLSFLETINEEKIRLSEAALKGWLGKDDLAGSTFLDIGSGSGLSSLVARRLGAEVRSFDYDPQSVAATNLLKQKYFPDDSLWEIERGSILDANLVESLGRFNIVYSWGVLHHTGNMWRAADHAASLVHDKGLLFISIYNDQVLASILWLQIKRLYNSSPFVLKKLILVGCWMYFSLRTLTGQVLRLLRGRLPRRREPRDRGMSKWHDMVDWVGGYPFEVAKPEEIFDFFRERGFSLLRLKTCAGGHGCNEYLFQRS